MSRRQAEAERQLDMKVNEEREKLKREAREQIMDEESANAILDQTRDWQQDMEEKRYESYMRNFAVQTGSQVVNDATSKEDEMPDKKTKSDKELAAVAKVVENKKADKIAAKVVKKDEAKPKSEKKAEKAPVSEAIPKKNTEKPALAKRASLA